jgi:hypothetical protein
MTIAKITLHCDTTRVKKKYMYSLVENLVKPSQSGVAALPRVKRSSSNNGQYFLSAHTTARHSFKFSSRLVQVIFRFGCRKFCRSIGDDPPMVIVSFLMQ